MLLTGCYLPGCYLPGCYLPGYPQGVPLLYTGAALRAARGTVYSRADPCGRPAGCRAACGLPGGLRGAGRPAGCRAACGVPDSLWGRAWPEGMALNSVASSLEREVVRCKKTCRNTGNEPNVSRR